MDFFKDVGTNESVQISFLRKKVNDKQRDRTKSSRQKSYPCTQRPNKCPCRYRLGWRREVWQCFRVQQVLVKTQSLEMFVEHRLRFEKHQRFSWEHRYSHFPFRRPSRRHHMPRTRFRRILWDDQQKRTPLPSFWTISNLSRMCWSTSSSSDITKINGEPRGALQHAVKKTTVRYTIHRGVKFSSRISGGSYSNFHKPLGTWFLFAW